jgi:hypothetical protein
VFLNSLNVNNLGEAAALLPGLCKLGKAGEPHLALLISVLIGFSQSTLHKGKSPCPALLLRWEVLSYFLSRLALNHKILPISVSGVAGITAVSHCSWPIVSMFKLENTEVEC